LAWQLPWTQAWPDGQAAQAPPPEPHALSEVPGAHEPPSQQPAQVALPHGACCSHFPDLQSDPEVHALHAPPPVPQLSSLVPTTHLPVLSQQPLQLAALHWGGVVVPPLSQPATSASAARSPTTIECARSISHLSAFELSSIIRRNKLLQGHDLAQRLAGADDDDDRL
jgi:hypothetical protein